ncbi:hypothetical protein Salat_0239800 [Sesamum alatum]|uniref:Myb/SANT-like domain-containing protein n=1 Tax=Sesamum alatum TaxID=300844 RepID=A0AAE1Z0G4_9LAMI|nr:hypothetical protein Salat_0239800 [Sesamum alatum]
MGVDPDESLLEEVDEELRNAMGSSECVVESIHNADYILAATIRDDIKNQMWENYVLHDGTWTSTTFDNIVKECVEKFGHVIDKENVKNRQKTLKTNFAACYDAFRGDSGFSWNPESQLFEAEPKVSKEIIEANSNAAKWRYTRIQNYDKLERLFAKDRAIGKGATSAKEKSHQWQQEENIMKLISRYLC